MKVSKDFLLAGKAIFTVEIPEQDRAAKKAEGLDVKPHYTFKVEKKAATAGFPETYFVHLLTGPDNTKSYTYLGVLNAKTGVIRTSAKSNFKEDSVPFRLVNYVVSSLIEGQALRAGYNLHHEGRCGKCGLPLTTPESVERGIGPECWKVVGGPTKTKKPAKKDPVVEAAKDLRGALDRGTQQDGDLSVKDAVELLDRAKVMSAEEAARRTINEGLSEADLGWKPDDAHQYLEAVAEFRQNTTAELIDGKPVVLVLEASELALPPGAWPQDFVVSWVHDDGRREVYYLTRGKGFYDRSGEDLGGFHYETPDGKIVTIFND
jgi:hypothetical protein